MVKKTLYHVYTENDSFSKCKHDIKNICEDMLGRKLFTACQHKMAKNMQDFLHIYFTLDYNEDEDCFVLLIIEPYDD